MDTTSPPAGPTALDAAMNSSTMEFIHVVRAWHFAIPGGIAWAYRSLEDAMVSAMILLNRMRADVGLMAIVDLDDFEAALQELRAAIALLETGHFSHEEDLNDDAGCRVWVENIPICTPEIMRLQQTEPYTAPHPDNIAVGNGQALAIHSESEAAWWNAETGWVADATDATAFDLATAVGTPLPPTEENDAVFVLVEVEPAKIM